MVSFTRTIPTVALLAAVIAAPLPAQAPAPQPNLLVGSIQLGAGNIHDVFAVASDAMSEADFAFTPAKDARSFAQLLAHVAESNYQFCSTAMGEKSPVADVEKTKTTRAEVRQVLTESFEYCDRAFATMNDETNAKAMREFRGHQFPALAVLNYRNYHALLHFGEAITYMRLRGKVPPTIE